MAIVRGAIFQPWLLSLPAKKGRVDQATGITRSAVWAVL